MWRLLAINVEVCPGKWVGLRSDSDLQVFLEIFVSCDYDQAILDSLEKSEGDVVFVDLGANVGLFGARVASLLYGMGVKPSVRVLAVEGNPKTFTRAEETFASVSGGDLTIISVCGLVGHRTGTAFISSNHHEGSQGIVGREVRSAIPFRGAYGVESKYVDLAEWLPQSAEIALLKCDIEGSESDFLLEYEDVLVRTRRLLIELHPLRTDVEKCRNLIRSYGFLIERQIQASTSMILESYIRVPNS